MDPVKQFEEEHPWPDKAGVTSLFRFFCFDLEHPEYLESLFLEQKLYHALPKEFNDPFECKPHFSWPEKATDVRKIRKHLIKLAKERGRNRKQAEKLASESMNNNLIAEATQQTYGELRICSFTTDYKNLLFWSHYADAHKGFCIELDASILPISYAYKVKYNDNYPATEYPLPDNSCALIPALTKSKAWEYEDEFRTIFSPSAESIMPNDGFSWSLSSQTIKKIYLGVNILPENQERLLTLINDGPFKPEIYKASLSHSSFSLDFYKL